MFGGFVSSSGSVFKTTHLMLIEFTMIIHRSTVRFGSFLSFFGKIKAVLLVLKTLRDKQIQAEIHV